MIRGWRIRKQTKTRSRKKRQMMKRDRTMAVTIFHDLSHPKINFSLDFLQRAPRQTYLWPTVRHGRSNAQTTDCMSPLILLYRLSSFIDRSIIALLLLLLERHRSSDEGGGARPLGSDFPDI